MSSCRRGRLSHRGILILHIFLNFQKNPVELKKNWLIETPPWIRNYLLLHIRQSMYLTQCVIYTTIDLNE